MNLSPKNNAIHLIQDFGDVFYYNNFLLKKEAEDLFHKMHQNIAWAQYPITMFGKKLLQPRLIAWHGDKGIRYKYSQTTLMAEGWTEELLYIKKQLQSQLGLDFNSVLLNLYRDGQDSMGWHSDDEKELGPQPIIASISLGCPRNIQFKVKTLHRNVSPEHPVSPNKPQKHQQLLASGSLLLMQGDTQKYWQHQIAKTKKVTTPRINLTFRNIL